MFLEIDGTAIIKKNIGRDYLTYSPLGSVSPTIFLMLYKQNILKIKKNLKYQACNKYPQNLKAEVFSRTDCICHGNFWLGFHQWVFKFGMILDKIYFLVKHLFKLGCFHLIIKTLHLIIDWQYCMHISSIYVFTVLKNMYMF